MSMSSNNHWHVAAQVEQIHEDALVCDFTLPFADMGDPRKRAATLPRFVASGVNCVSLSLGGDTGGIADTMKLLARERNYFLQRTDEYVLVTRADDMLRAKSENKLGVVFHFQGTDPLQGSLDMVETYYQLGVRHMLLAYNFRNPVGDGCFEPNDSGLSLFGKKLVREFNRVGMIVDCSHTGCRTGLDAMEISTSPVIFSHANPAGVYLHPRNITDEQIKSCAQTGGVVGILGVSNMLGPEQDASTELLVRHIDYCVQLVGVDHVGISLDFVFDPEATYLWALSQARGELPANYTADMPLVQPEQFPHITGQLLALGYSASDVRKVLGENWHRVATEVWWPE